MEKTFVLTVWFGRYDDGDISTNKQFTLIGKSVRKLKSDAYEIIRKLQIQDYRVSLGGVRKGKTNHYFSNL